MSDLPPMSTIRDQPHGDKSPGSSAYSPPPMIPGYQLKHVIGRGATGIVWRAYHIATRRDVALKLLQLDHELSDLLMKRFEREVETAANLDHPGIAPVYDSGLHEGVYFYTMALVEGLPVDKFRRTQKLGRDAFVQLMVRICEGVEHAHQHGIIHRDLKPSNILVTPDGQPHLLDFGLAKLHVESGLYQTLSAERERSGTPAYMSPEQASGDQLRIVMSSDVYALGVMLYEGLLGQHPHGEQPNIQAMMRAVAEQPIVAPCQVRRRFNREIQAILQRALTPDPQDRYRTAGALADDLKRFLRREPVLAKPPSILYVLRKQIVRHKLFASVITAAVLGLALMGFYTFISVKHERDMAKSALHQAQQARLNEMLTNADAARHQGELLAARNGFVKSQAIARDSGLSDLAARVGLWDLKNRGLLPVAEFTLPTSLTQPVAQTLTADGRVWAVMDRGAKLWVFDARSGQVLAQKQVPNVDRVRRAYLHVTNISARVGDFKCTVLIEGMRTGPRVWQMSHDSQPDLASAGFALQDQEWGAQSVGAIADDHQTVLWYNGTTGKTALFQCATGQRISVLPITSMTHAAFTKSGDHVVAVSQAADVGVMGVMDAIGHGLDTIKPTHANQGRLAVWAVNPINPVAQNPQYEIDVPGVVTGLATGDGVACDIMIHTRQSRDSRGFQAESEHINGDKHVGLTVLYGHTINTDHAKTQDQPLVEMATFHRPQTSRLSSSAEGRFAMELTAGRTAYLWPIGPHHWPGRVALDAPITAAAFDRSGKVLITGRSQGEIVLHAADDGHVLQILHIANGPVVGLRLSDDGRQVLAATSNRQVVLVDIQSALVKHTWTPNYQYQHQSLVDQPRSGQGDATVTYDMLAQILGGIQIIPEGDFSEDGRYIVMPLAFELTSPRGMSATIHLIDTQTGATIRQWQYVHEAYHTDRAGYVSLPRLNGETVTPQDVERGSMRCRFLAGSQRVAVALLAQGLWDESAKPTSPGSERQATNVNDAPGQNPLSIYPLTDNAYFPTPPHTARPTSTTSTIPPTIPTILTHNPNPDELPLANTFYRINHFVLDPSRRRIILHADQTLYDIDAESMIIQHQRPWPGPVQALTLTGDPNYLWLESPDQTTLLPMSQTDATSGLILSLSMPQPAGLINVTRSALGHDGVYVTQTILAQRPGVLVLGGNSSRGAICRFNALE